MKNFKKYLPKSLAIIGGSLLFGLGVSEPAMAQEGLDTGDTAWMLTSTLLVLMMTIPGVALFYGGMVRKKNLLSTLMQSFAITCLVTLIWMVAGYSLAFSPDSGFLGISGFVGDLSNAFVGGIKADTMSGTIPESVFFVFQMTFAIITAALITGAVAERMKFSALLIFIGVWSIAVYSPITHWVWYDGGLLWDLGVLDFAGGTVVHINSGIAALVACLILGKRLGYGTENLAPHNVSLTLIGGSLLWVGWFGFNAGSALGANGGAGMAMAVTQIASAAAGLSWMLIEWAKLKKPSLLGAVTGAVAGLVAITPASGFVDPMGALFIGLIAGGVCFWGASSLKKMVGYDDSLDVFAVHGLGGITGAILTGVFAVEAIGGTPGALEGNIGQVWIQIQGILATIIYSGGVSALILLALKYTIGIRVEEEEEREGLDIRLHGESVV